SKAVSTLPPRDTVRPSTVPTTSTRILRTFSDIRVAKLPQADRFTLAQASKARESRPFRHYVRRSTPFGASRNPLMRVHRLAVLANLEIERRRGLPAAVADLADRLAGRDPVAGFLQQHVVVAVERHEAVPVIDDHEQAE